MFRSVITGTGAYIPPVVQLNEGFLQHLFYTADSRPLAVSPAEAVKKFGEITGIGERRYAPESMNTSDIAAIAARRAVKNSGIDPETLDQVIVAHNYGDIPQHTVQMDGVPSLASRVKHGLGIKNPSCIPYDILFGCPGWLQGLIQADLYCRAGAAKKCLIIGAETLSRVVDDYDRDSMIFSDGAGACIIEYRQSEGRSGIVSTSVRSDTVEEVDYIYFGRSNAPDADARTRYIKMKGRKVYEYALKYVPAAMKECFDKSGADISELKKIFIHQANEKMDESIVRAFYQLYGVPSPACIMPMCIHWLGNSSVATIPTLYDLVRKNQVEDHALQSGDLVMFASVGAGMNINAVCYRY